MTERVIVITGASAGIGEALALELGAQKHALVLAARREGELRRVADAAQTRTRIVVADVTRRSDVECIRDEAISAFGHIDVWVNNAGQGITRPALGLSDEEIDAMMAINVKAVLYGMQAVIPHFQQRGSGHVINVSSFLGRVPVASVRSAYSAAKAAMNSLSANVRMDLSRVSPGVHVSVVMPGMVSTEFAKHTVGGFSAPSPQVAAGPMRPQTPQEVAKAIASVIEHPVAELYTNPLHADLARRYFEDPAAFEAQIPPPPAR